MAPSAEVEAAEVEAAAPLASLPDVSGVVARHLGAREFCALACACRGCRDATRAERSNALRRACCARYRLLGFALPGDADGPGRTLPPGDEDEDGAATLSHGNGCEAHFAAESLLRGCPSSWGALLRDATRGGAPARQLLWQALGASSTDNPAESAHNTLAPSPCTVSGRHRQCSCHRPWPLPSRPCYWSSTASGERNTDEWLEYSLAPAGPLVVEALELAPYCAFWQPDDPTTLAPPTYWPNGVRLEVRDGQSVLYTSRVFEISDEEVRAGPRRAAAGGDGLGGDQGDQSDGDGEEGEGGLDGGAEGGADDGAGGDAGGSGDPPTSVRFALDPPLLLARGGLTVRVHLLGKKQRQTFEEMSDYYTCVNYVLLAGRVLTRHHALWVDGETGEQMAGAQAAMLTRISPSRPHLEAPSDGGPPVLLAATATAAAAQPQAAQGARPVVLSLDPTARRCHVCMALHGRLACGCGSVWWCSRECAERGSRARRHECGTMLPAVTPAVDADTSSEEADA